jgi:hypothetical protein
MKVDEIPGEKGVKSKESMRNSKFERYTPSHKSMIHGKIT